MINKAIIRQKPAPNGKSHVWASTTGKFLHDMATIPKVIPSAPRIILNAAATSDASSVRFPKRERASKGVLGNLRIGSLALCELLRLQNQLNFWFICFGMRLNLIPTKVRTHPVIVKATVVTISTPFSKLLKILLSFRIPYYVKP